MDFSRKKTRTTSPKNQASSRTKNYQPCCRETPYLFLIFLDINWLRASWLAIEFFGCVSKCHASSSSFILETFWNCSMTKSKILNYPVDYAGGHPYLLDFTGCLTVLLIVSGFLVEHVTLQWFSLKIDMFISNGTFSSCPIKSHKSSTKRIPYKRRFFIAMESLSLFLRKKLTFSIESNLFEHLYAYQSYVHITFTYIYISLGNVWKVSWGATPGWIIDTSENPTRRNRVVRSIIRWIKHME